MHADSREIHRFVPRSRVEERNRRLAGVLARVDAVAVGAAFAAVAWWYVSTVGPSPGGLLEVIAWWLAGVAYLWVAAAGVTLTVVDIACRRLPDALVLPSLGIVTGLLSASALLTTDWVKIAAVLGGAGVLFIGYLLLGLAAPGEVGGGDVKLAPLIGAVTGYIGWGALVVGAIAGVLIGAIAGLAVMLLRRSVGPHPIPFGPCMVVGAWIGIVWGESLAGEVLRLTGAG